MVRPLADYTAARNIPDPNAFAINTFAYREGDDVQAGAVENWGLVVGEDVFPARHGLRARPAANASRADWEDYAVHEGVPLAEARELTRDELAKRIPEEEEGPTGMALLGGIGRDTQPVDEPVDENAPPPLTAKKDAWVTYAVEQRGWTKEDAELRTKVDLVAELGPNPRLS